MLALHIKFCQTARLYSKYIPLMASNFFHLPERIHDILDHSRPQLRLGVTGLSRSGKTIFITALIHALTRGARLPLFTPVASKRMEAGILQPQPNLDLPRFAFEQNIDALLSPSNPQWPQGTERLSQLRLSLKYKPRNPIERGLLGHKRLDIDIIDYPGEWLMDLPLMELSFSDWSQRVFQAFETSAERQSLAQDWRTFLGSIDISKAQDERTLITLSQLYTDYLQKCRTDGHMLSLLQPGRFLMPGDLAGSPVLTFCPLPAPSKRAGNNSLYAESTRRFEAYKQKVVKPFFLQHFSRLDRQLVLCDILGAAASGKEAMLELQSAIQEILGCFRPGTRSWLQTLLKGKRIDKIMFAATKADHIPDNQHQKMSQLLEELSFECSNSARYKGANLGFCALASIRATQAAKVRHGQQTLHCITGRLDGEEEPMAYYLGDLPSHLQAFKSGIEAPIAFARFAPPKPVDGRRFEHLGLDRILDFLLGDLMR